MKYLLDTHIWLWGLLEPSRIAPEVVAVLSNIEYEFYISPVSVWETRILAERGKIALNLPVAEWITEALSKGKLKEAKLTHAIALKSRQMTPLQKGQKTEFLTPTHSCSTRLFSRKTRFFHWTHTD